MPNIRISELNTTATEAASDDYLAIDGQTNGTRKILAKKLTEGVESQLATIDQNVSTNTADITDLKEDLSQKAPAIYNTSNESEVVTFADGADDMPMKSVVLKLVPHQEGTGDPSPDNVRPISGYTAVNVTMAGKNLANVTATGSASSGGMTYTVNADKTVDVSGTRTGTSYRQVGTFKGVNGVIYKFTGVPDEIADNPGPARLYLARGNTTIYATHAGATFTYLDSMGDLGIVIRTDAQISGTIRFKPMVRLASITDTAYEPYESTTYPITIPSSAGTVYGGELDVTNGVLRVTHGIVDLGNYNWTYNSTYGFFVSPTVSEGASTKPTGYSDVWASAYTTYYTGSTIVLSQIPNNSVIYGTNAASSTQRIIVKDTRYTDASSLKTAVTGVKCVYPIATPTEITLDPVTVKTLLGFNTIWMDADGTLQADYPADTKLYIDALTAPDDDMIADSNIASGKYFTVNNKLYLSTSAIAQGEQIVVGTNCTQTDLATALNALNA